MVFQPAENAVQAEFRFTWQGQQVENVEHFYMENITAAAMAELAENLYMWWANSLSTQVSSTVLLREVSVFDLTVPDGAQASYANAPLVGGSNLQESVTNATTICLSLRTAQRGRSRRGRLYHIGLTENVVADNRVSQAALDALDAAYTQLIGPVVTGGPLWSVLSRQSQGVARPVASLATITSVLFVDNVVDSQRRRLPGRGT